MKDQAFVVIETVTNHPIFIYFHLSVLTKKEIMLYIIMMDLDINIYIYI